MQFCKAAKVKEIQSRLFKIRFRVLEIVYWNIYDEILGYICRISLFWVTYFLTFWQSLYSHFEFSIILSKV